MLSNSQIEILTKVIDLSSNLLSACLTLVALIPALIQIVGLKSPDFISRMESENKVRNLMFTLGAAVILFAVAILCGIVARLISSDELLMTGAAAFFAGLFVIVLAACQVVWKLRTTV